MRSLSVLPIVPENYYKIYILAALNEALIFFIYKLGSWSVCSGSSLVIVLYNHFIIKRETEAHTAMSGLRSRHRRNSVRRLAVPVWGSFRQRRGF